uniref:Zinc finger PMZ-type domain-containing protein n=1 Tax=Phaseolus vulgaris TaxID=3885 RepID=V7BNH5_PHAVU|nr:hypothetical protein PHAVU_006G014300g [Phaseolus vulgaris]ESW18116.1 hypothetical protein PHAVU_006G014300g [Phaseolus vulgaris]
MDVNGGLEHPLAIDGVQDNSCYIFECVFWAFNHCIDDFNYCKPIVQVDRTFLTEKYHGTLLTAIGQDGNRNVFPLAFAIVEEFAWEGHGLLSVYCIRHIASNFNKKFKNAEAKRQLINMGRRYDHITTNLAECMNSVLKKARSLPICALVKTIFERTKSWFVERGTKIRCMLRVGHQYPEDIIALLRENEQQSAILNDWWCYCGEFQALQFPCAHVIVVYSTCHLQPKKFIDLIYSLQYILRAYKVEFHPVRNEDY